MKQTNRFQQELSLGEIKRGNENERKLQSKLRQLLGRVHRAKRGANRFYRETKHTEQYP